MPDQLFEIVVRVQVRRGPEGDTCTQVVEAPPEVHRHARVLGAAPLLYEEATEILKLWRMLHESDRHMVQVQEQLSHSMRHLQKLLELIDREPAAMPSPDQPVN